MLYVRAWPLSRHSPVVRGDNRSGIGRWAFLVLILKLHGGPYHRQVITAVEYMFLQALGPFGCTRGRMFHGSQVPQLTSNIDLQDDDGICLVLRPVVAV